MTTKKCILVVDDSSGTLEILDRNLTSAGYKVLTADNVKKASAIFDKNNVDLVITDYKMPVSNGFDLMEYIHACRKNIPVLMITGYPSVKNAVKAMRMGADNYLAKPFTEDELFKAVKEIMNKRENDQRNDGKSQFERWKKYGLIGKSKEIKKVFNSIDKSAKSSATVLINGESGTGKELVARAIHYNSSRSAFPFVPVNCGAIPENLLESELFGHVKGAFSGANESRCGFFQTAEKGTIFLDEISETSPIMQVKLLRFLQNREISMLGSSKIQKVDVRIIAATNKNLETLIKKEIFREDLFYRINVISINVPPLRERTEDILILTNYFLEKYSLELSYDEKPLLSDKVVDILKKYNWPGNVRELENVIQRIVIMSEKNLITETDLPSFTGDISSTDGNSWNKSLSQAENQHIINVLKQVEGNKSKAAKILDIDRKTLREKLKKAYE